MFLIAGSLTVACGEQMATVSFRIFVESYFPCQNLQIRNWHVLFQLGVIRGRRRECGCEISNCKGV
jgi:hypothetical protein